MTMGVNCAGDCAIPAGQTICQMTPDYTKKMMTEMMQESPEMKKMKEQVGDKNMAIAMKCGFLGGDERTTDAAEIAKAKAACEAEEDCEFEGAGKCQPKGETMLENMADGGDMCKGMGVFAQMSLESPDGEPTKADMDTAMQDKNTLAAFQTIQAQGSKCGADKACDGGTASYCIKAGEDCEPDFIPFLKSNKCGSSIIAKVTKAMARSKAADLVEAKAELATATAKVAELKAEKETADAELVKCGDTCSQAEKTAATTAKGEYEAAQRTETAAATKSSNKVASVANADVAAQTGAAENGAAQVAVGAAVVLGVLTAQLF